MKQAITPLCLVWTVCVVGLAPAQTPQEIPEDLQEMFELRKAHLEQDIEEFRRTSRSKVVLLEGADHYVFLTHERDVLREMRAFLDDLAAEPSP